MDWTWLLVIGALIAQVLNIKKRRSCWIIWAIIAVVFGLESYKANLISQTVLWMMYFVTDCWGFFAWGDNERRDKIKS